MWSHLSSSLFVCLSVCEVDYVKASRELFVKPCRIVHQFYGKSQLNCVISPCQNGRVAAIFSLLWWSRICWKWIIIDAHSPDGVCVLHIVYICLVEVCGLQTACSVFHFDNLHTVSSVNCHFSSWCGCCGDGSPLQVCSVSFSYTDSSVVKCRYYFVKFILDDEIGQ